MKQRTLLTPLGPMVAVEDNGFLVHLFFSPKSEDQEREDKKSSPLFDLLEKEFDLYFEGKLQEFTTPTSLTGTPFQRSVWEELKKIPYGKTTSYGQIAKKLGKPQAYRAVAQANGANLIPILYPCHRVIYADGSLGGYSSGLDKKIQLLKTEGITLGSF
jgi:O-6-methylguanine DNA methyltransferase